MPTQTLDERQPATRPTAKDLQRYFIPTSRGDEIHHAYQTVKEREQEKEKRTEIERSSESTWVERL